MSDKTQDELLALFGPGIEIGKGIVDELLALLRADNLATLLSRLIAMPADELGCGLFVAICRLRGHELRGEQAR